MTRLILVTVLVLAGPADLLADVTGKILGTVTDSSGAAVVGATVTLHNDLTTGYTQAVKSDSTGYQFLAVPIGQGYEVAVEASGFSKAIQSGIVLLVNHDFRADFKLHVGTTRQTVEASAVMQVETTSTQLGDVIEDQKIMQMPLNGRSYVDLIGLQVGVVPQISSAAFYPSNVQKVSGRPCGWRFLGQWRA